LLHLITLTDTYTLGQNSLDHRLASHRERKKERERERESLYTHIGESLVIYR